jgi:hexokinase
VHTALVDIFGEKGKNIVTHHAEDGSGVGSAIIAGEYTACVSWLELMIAMTKARKDAGFFVDY